MVSKQDLYQAYARHNADSDLSDHLPGSDPNCAVCDDINRITQLLEEKTSSKASGKRASVRYTPKVVAVEDPLGNQAIYRVKSLKQENAWLKDAVYHRLTKRDQDSFYIGENVGDVISLSDYIKKNPNVSGLIAIRRQKN